MLVDTVRIACGVGRSPAGGGGVVIAVREYIRLQVFVVGFAGKVRRTVFLYASFAKYRCVLVIFYKISLGGYTIERTSLNDYLYDNIHYRHIIVNISYSN